MSHGFTTDRGWLIDRLGRPTLLRGVNLSGATKVPVTPPGATHLGVSFDGWADVSFVGRPAVGRSRCAPRPHRRVGPELPPTAHHVGGDRARGPRRV